MPELPEVETTVKDLGVLLPGLKISNVWTSYNSPYYYNKKQIKDPKYFRHFKKRVIGQQIKGTRRVGKNVLIVLDNDETILIHMKMTGHLLYGKYVFKNKEWIAKEEGPLKDPFNGWIRLVFTLSNGMHLALSDMRKFGKVSLLKDVQIEKLGIDALQVSLKEFKELILSKPNSNLKTVLMNQELISGIGNIYSDEALWLSKLHPKTKPTSLQDSDFKRLFKDAKNVLKKGIKFGGDSMSDYRTPNGEKGNFQNYHNVYQLKGNDCKRKECTGKIQRIVVDGRSSHFCDVCQRNIDDL